MKSLILFTSRWEIFRQTYYFSLRHRGLRDRVNSNYIEIPFSMLFNRNEYFSRIRINVDIVATNLGFDFAI
jgi:hypothetical protein